MVRRNKQKGVGSEAENIALPGPREAKQTVKGSKRKSAKYESTSDSDASIQRPQRKRQKVQEENYVESVMIKPKKAEKKKKQTSRQTKATNGQRKRGKSAKSTLQAEEALPTDQAEDLSSSKLTRKKLEKCKQADELRAGKKKFKKESAATVTTLKQEPKSTGNMKFIGAHCSISGGLYKAVLESVDMGGSAFALFLKGQRQWQSKPLEDKDAQKFKDTCKEYEFPPHLIVPHGSYLMNCGSPNEETLRKSRAMLVEELQRCERLGLALFNFHPGSTCGEIPVEESITRIADSINAAHQQTKYVISVIENMSCQGNTIGGKFNELRAIINKVKDKARVGVCLDTCHAFAAGHNIATAEGYEAMMSEFESTVGLKYLKAVHLNDSKEGCGCHKDRHENIGRGKIGLEGFRRLVNDPRFDNIPLVLETPEGDYAREIKKLYSLINK